MYYYCGLDVSRKSTHVHIEDGQGKRVMHRVVPTTPEGLESALDNYFARGLRVAVEAGGSTGWIHDLLRELGAQVHVGHPTKVKWIAASKKKTDRVDARLLAHLLRINGLPEAVHMPTRQSREVRRLLRARRQLVQIRTRLINVVRSVLEQQQVNLRAGALGSRKGWRALYNLPLLLVFGISSAPTTPLSPPRRQRSPRSRPSWRFEHKPISGWHSSKPSPVLAL
jgi:transposase